jgi:CRISPR/Cas system-associated exonuclease Cas4 (RecB family)
VTARNLPQPARLAFSQSSLQDFVDCPRRFELRYLLGVRWPAVESEPLLEVEQAMMRGQRFHRLAQQYWLGADSERLAAFAQDDSLPEWWRNFTRFAQTSDLHTCCRLLPEARLTAPIAGQRLVASLDLLAVAPDGRMTIYDWKTSVKRPKRAWLKERWQTRIYPYLLAVAGAHFSPTQAIAPEQIEMVYWFAAHPDEPERLAYSAAQMRQDEADLTALIEQIVRFIAEAQAAPETRLFTMTEHTQRCAFCEYRSLCERGSAGDFADFEEDLDAPELTQEGFNFEQITEVSY